MPKRPLYNEKWRPEFTDDIYSIIANGGSIRIIANKYDVDRETAWRWLMKDADKYREARDSRVSIRVEGMFECFDELRKGTLDVAVFREMKDVIKWTSGRESSSLYADSKKDIADAIVSYQSYLDTLPKK